MLCRQQAAIILNHENVYVRNTGQGNAQQNLVAVRLATVHVSIRCYSRRHKLLYKAWADRPGVHVDILCRKCKKS